MGILSFFYAKFEEICNAFVTVYLLKYEDDLIRIKKEF